MCEQTAPERSDAVCYRNTTTLPVIAAFPDLCYGVAQELYIISCIFASKRMFVDSPPAQQWAIYLIRIQANL